MALVSLNLSPPTITGQACLAVSLRIRGVYQHCLPLLPSEEVQSNLKIILYVAPLFAPYGPIPFEEPATLRHF
jgi:hypothetical protein